MTSYDTPDRECPSCAFIRAAYLPHLGHGPMWPLDEIRPTQMTVGWREVARKQRRLRADQAVPTSHRATPVVLGPSAAVYALDHHHRLCAMVAEGWREAPINVIDDLSHLAESSFWRLMDSRGWCRPYDPAGLRKPFCEIPNRLADLADDPIRSLASTVRRRGGFAKSKRPFSEFRWADYLRLHITADQIGADYIGATANALEIARSCATREFPGWHSPVAASSLTSAQLTEPDQGWASVPTNSICNQACSCRFPSLLAA